MFLVLPMISSTRNVGQKRLACWICSSGRLVSQMETKIDWDSVVRTEILKREGRAAHFIKHVFDISEFWLTDDSCLSDFKKSDDTQEIRNRTVEAFGYPLQQHHFSLPLWMLLDELERYFKKARVNKLAPQTEVLERLNAIGYFCDQVLGVRPIYLTDAFTLGDFVNLDDPNSTEIVGEQTYRVYGTRLTREHYEMPFWKLLDELEENCLRSELAE
jgi:hypothetical protein